jgi:hypothetical protein
MGNGEILETVELVLRMQTWYGLSVEYDIDGNLIMKVATLTKITPDNLTQRNRSAFHENSNC